MKRKPAEACVPLETQSFNAERVVPVMVAMIFLEVQNFLKQKYSLKKKN